MDTFGKDYFNIVYGTDIIAINGSNKNNHSDNSIYKDRRCNLHQIALEACTKNYAKTKWYASKCIGVKRLMNAMRFYIQTGY